MKHWILAAACLVSLDASHDASATIPPEIPATSLATVSGTASDAAFVSAGADSVQKMQDLTHQALAAIPSGPWNGRLDRSYTDFHLGGWQSLKSLDQAYGLSKPAWTLNKGAQPILNVGLFAGVQKPLDPLAGSSLRFLAGETITVPGSALDWALGTKMGSYWLPKAKAGLLIAHDWTRPAALHWCPDFVGVGLSYGIGGGS